MKTTLEDVLTSADARDIATIEASLVQETSAGLPWFDEA